MALEDLEQVSPELSGETWAMSRPAKMRGLRPLPWPETRLGLARVSETSSLTGTLTFRGCFRPPPPRTLEPRGRLPFCYVDVTQLRKYKFNNSLGVSGNHGFTSLFLGSPEDSSSPQRNSIPFPSRHLLPPKAGTAPEHRHRASSSQS